MLQPASQAQEKTRWNRWWLSSADTTAFALWEVGSGTCRTLPGTAAALIADRQRWKSDGLL
jgi:hypothetical protein